MTDDCFLSLGEAAQLALMRAQWKMLLRQRKARLAASVGAERQEFFRSGEAAMNESIGGPGLIPASASGACFHAAQRLSGHEPDTASACAHVAGLVEDRALTRTSFRAAADLCENIHGPGARGIPERALKRTAPTVALVPSNAAIGLWSAIAAVGLCTPTCVTDTQAVPLPHLEDRNGGTEDGDTSEGPFALCAQVK